MATSQILISGNANAPTTGTTSYTQLMGNGQTPDSTEEYTTEIIPTPGTLTNFQAGITTAPGDGKSWVFTVRLGSAGGAMGDTALSVTISGAVAVLSSLDTDTVAVTAGQRVCISSTPSGTPTAAGAIYKSCTFIPTTAGETILIGNSAATPLVANNYHNLVAGHGGDATLFDASTLFPTAGTLKNFYVELTAAPGAGNSRTFAIGTLSVTISGASATTGNDTNPANNVDIAAGNSAAILHTVTNTPAAARGKWGVVFLPDTQGEFITSATTDDATSSTTVEYQTLTCADTILTSTEAEQYGLCSVACTAKSIYIALGTSPGSGNAWVFTLRRNGTTNTAETVTLTNAQTGNASADVAISAADLLSTSIDARAGTATSTSQISYLFYITPTGGGWTHIAKVNGVASAGIAKINNVAVANIAKLCGTAV